MRSGPGIEIAAALCAALLGIALVGLLMVYNSPPLPDGRSYPSELPGAGWGWSFDYRLGMQGPGRGNTPASSPRTPRAADVVELTVHRPARIGDIRITFRGLAPGKRFRVDLVIPALDPHYSYPREFGIADARGGFTLGGRRFVLLDAGRDVLRLRTETTDAP